MSNPCSNLTICILAHNASQTIETALKSATFAQEILVLDDSSTDNTKEICQQYTQNIFSSKQQNFAQKRNELLSKLKTDWIFYLDSDEVVSSELAASISTIVTSNQPGAYRIRRTNFFLGTKMYPDYVDRLFHHSVIKNWVGDVHESPQLIQSPNIIEQPLLHYTHANITSMLEKTNKWSEYEADLRIKANHPPVAWWRLIRIAITVWQQQFIRLKVGKFGRQGLFEGYFQIVDKLIVYTKLWERQQKS